MTSRQKALGQYFTDQTIADYMAELGYFAGATSILDPAVGTGAFVDALDKKAGAARQYLHYTVFDLDESVLDRFRAKNRSHCEINQKDYLTSATGQTYDLILCNPPYNRFLEIPNRWKYIDLFRERYGIKICGHSNLCVYFLVKSMHELKEGGRCIYILPYEFMNTGYGAVIKEYLIQSRMLKSILKFENSLRLFPDAVTTSCILFLENTPQNSIDFVTLSSPGGGRFIVRKTVAAGTALGTVLGALTVSFCVGPKSMIVHRKEFRVDPKLLG